MFGLQPGLPGGGITGVLPASGVGTFISRSMSGGQITPLVCPSLSLSVWLPRSRSVYAFGLEFCAKTEKPAANATAIAAAAKYFGYLPTRIERCRSGSRRRARRIGRQNSFAFE